MSSSKDERDRRWDSIWFRLREIYQTRPAESIRLERLIKLLKLDTSIAEIPRVSVGWLTYSRINHPGHVFVSLHQEADYYSISVEDPSLTPVKVFSVKLDDVPTVLAACLEE